MRFSRWTWGLEACNGYVSFFANNCMLDNLSLEEFRGCSENTSKAINLAIFWGVPIFAFRLETAPERLQDDKTSASER